MEAGRRGPEGTKWKPADDAEGTRWPPAAEKDELTPTGSWTPSLGSGRHFQPCRFGDFQLLEVIARGGMDVVYRAQHVASGRLVALKTILPGRLATAEDVERFLNEARAAARLDHPHITPIYQIGEVDGHHFFTTALATGGTLQQRVRDGLLPVWVAADGRE